jgi:undecaprenyl-diphosphatase
MSQIIEALFLGLIEGLTEFLPVSSTGHLLLVGHFLGFESTGKTFEVLIQLGAILAILSVYFNKLWSIAKALPHDPMARHFVIGVLVAFLPAAVIGAVLHGFIKEVLFDPWIVCTTLIIGGFVLLAIDRLPLEATKTDATRFPMAMYFKIGLIQCAAMVPGVSASKRAAAEFSFFLAMPTMAGAFTYDLLKNYRILSANDAAIIVAGFLSAFVAALLVVKLLLDYVSRHGFTPFAYWRILVGAAGLAGLIVYG